MLDRNTWYYVTMHKFVLRITWSNNLLWIIIYSWWVFNSWWSLHWSLSDSKSLQVSRTLLSILANLNNAVVWMVLILSLIFNSFSLFFQTFGDHSKCPNYNWYHCLPHHPQFLVLCQGPSIRLFLCFYFHSVIHWNGKIHSTAHSFFLLINPRSSFLTEIWWSVCIIKFQRILCVAFFRMDFGLCIYHLVVWSNFNFLHNSQWNTFPTQSYLILILH